jgi:Zn-dependent protease with chaperone function
MTRIAEDGPPTEPAAAGAASNVDLPVNDLARSYQPRRTWAAAVGIAWNLLLAGAFVLGGPAEGLYRHLAPAGAANVARGSSWIAPVYLGILFAGYAALNFPVELWFGYLGERQYGLAKDGVRAWARDWLKGTIQHGVMFVIGGCLLVACQIVAPEAWLAMAAGVLLVLFLVTTYFSADLVPPGLFQVQGGDEGVVARLTRLASEPPKQDGASFHLALPRVVVYSHPSLREFAGGIVGLGNRQVFMISRATVELASDTMLRFVLLHDLGHRRFHHNLLSALAGWAWVVMGLVVGHEVIPARWGHGTVVFGSPMYVAFLALTLSVWMAIGEPVLAYFGRRLEYQADRFFLRNGGTTAEMRVALAELAERNLARTESMRRRETIFHPLPSVANRLYAAREFERRLGREG